MGLLITLTVGLAFWIVGFALSWGRSPIDPFLVTVLLVVIAITVRAVKPFVRRLTGNES
jgi:xanthosine utilization system XapX-like protein